MKQHDVTDMPGYSEVLQKIVEAWPVEKRLAGLTAEERLAGLAPEQRLAGLDPDHQALALPIVMLRALSDSYISSLAPEIQEEIRRRLRTEGH